MSDLTAMEYVIRELKNMNSNLSGLNDSMSRIATALEERNDETNWDYDIHSELEKIRKAMEFIGSVQDERL